MTASSPSAYRPMSLARQLRSAAMRFPARIALRMEKQTLSYATLAQRTAQCTSLAVGHFGLQPGDICALIAPNCIEYAEIVAGISESGAIVATLNPRLAAAEFQSIFADCEPRAAIVHPDCAAAITALSAHSIPTLILGASYDQQLARAQPGILSGVTDETQSFAMAYTSGTTGQPKGVLLSHRSRVLTAKAMAAEYGCFGPDDHFLAIAPMYHGAGFIFACAPLFHGGQVTILPHFDSCDVVEALGSGSYTGVFVVPTHVHRLLGESAEALRRCREGHRLKAIISNAAALPQRAKEGMIEAFGDGLLHESYGSTEAGIVTNIHPVDLRHKPNSVGTPFIGMEIELRDPSGQIVAPGQIGELFARSAYSFNGYWKRPEETAQTILDGWVTVGDMAVRDADGFISIVDRKKDMVITGGINVYPGEIEKIIATVSGVQDVAVVGLPDAEWGERLHAFVVSGLPAPQAETIIDACRASLAGFKVPRGISFIDELPRNPSGKLLKRALRDRALETA